MQEEGSNMDVKNTREMIKTLTELVADLAKAKSDDQRISAFEMAGIAVENYREIIDAVQDAHLVVAELKDVDTEEVKVLIEDLIDLSKAVALLFMKAK